MSKLTNEHKELITKIKTKTIDELYELAEEYSGTLAEMHDPNNPNDPEREKVINRLQIIIIMLALKRGDYEKYIQTVQQIDEVFDAPTQTPAETPAEEVKS